MWECPECRLQFHSEKLLGDHILRIHRTKPVSSLQYQCPQCSGKWSRFESFLSHQRICSGNEAGPSNAGEDTLQNEHFDLERPLVGDFEVRNDQADEFQARDIEAPDEDLEADVSAEQHLHRGLLDFVVHLKNDCYATQSIVDEVVRGVDKIKDMVLNVVEKLLQDKADAADLIRVADVGEVLSDLKQMTLFDGIDSQEEVLKFLEENHGLVMPQKVALKHQNEIQNQQLVTKDVDFFYLVPFLDQLERLLNCEDVLYCVDNPRESIPFTYSTVLDGVTYQQHPVKLKNGKVLCIIFYHDGVEVVDSASTRTGKHNMTFFFWTLGNIFPEYRSLSRSLHLYAIVKTADLKVYGYDLIMKNFINGVNRLSSDEGVTFHLHGVPRVMHGFLQVVEGDYPALGAISCTKEAVSAEKPCHDCFASNSENYLQIADINQFQLRSKEEHERQVAEVLAYNDLPARLKIGIPDPSVQYGVNGRSVLMDINYFNISKGLAQDLMHVAHEGVLQLTCQLVLQHVVEGKQLSLEEVNRRISVCSKSFAADRPGVILKDHLCPPKILRQSAAQMRVLSVLLPFVLQKKSEDGGWTFAGDKVYLDCLIALLKIMNLLSAHKHHISDVQKLREKIKRYHEMMLLLVPDIAMAKLHFLHHLPDLIVLHGSIRQLATFRFEGLNALFKRYVKICHNFVNPMLTIATRFQTRQCRQMMMKNFYFENFECTEKCEVTGFVDVNVNLMKSCFPEFQRLIEVTRVKVYGTTLKKDSVILLSETQPEFGFITKLYRVDQNDFGLICLKMKTRKMDENVNAFEVCPLASKVVIDVKKLVYPHDVTSLKWQGKWFALLQAHRTLLA